MLAVLGLGEMALVTGGFQQVTDRMLAAIGDSARCGVDVQQVDERDGLVHTRCRVDGRDVVVRSERAVVAAQAPAAARLVPGMPEEQRQALQAVRYGPIVMVSVIFRRDVPWQRFLALMSDDSVFQGVVDQTLDTPGRHPGQPAGLQLHRHAVPRRAGADRPAPGASDEELVADVLADFQRIIPVPAGERVEDYVLDTTVTRYPLGEIELSPEYFTEQLPHLATPVGNIHFAGDYTHYVSFVEGAVYSAFRVARALGSDRVVSEEDEHYFRFLPALKYLLGLGR